MNWSKSEVKISKGIMFYVFKCRRGASLSSYMTQWGKVNKKSNFSAISYYIDN